jgi:DNA-binding response OmpR family regulator
MTIGDLESVSDMDITINQGGGIDRPPDCLLLAEDSLKMKAMRILVVDDDRMVLEAMKHNLGIRGYEVVTANTVLEALEIAASQKLDLIISDVIMPDISGLSLLSMLRRFYLYKVPIIIISSLDKKEIISSSVNLGADDFLKKPINYEELHLRVKHYCKSD